MKKFNLCILSCVFALQLIYSQIATDNSQIISAILAPDGEAAHTNCNQQGFGGHYNEIVDEDLNVTVSQFQIHKTEDVEACKNFGTRFNEIKTIADAPKNLLGTEGETITYSWKFKFSDNFTVRENNLDIHQLKAVGGDEAHVPLFTLTTTRKGRFESLELRYSEDNEQVILETIDITNLKGQWIEVSETITYNEIGAYDISIKTVKGDETILEHSDDAIRTWRTDAGFIRPKWGIYKESNEISTTLGKSILFTDFKIEENANISAFQSSLDSAAISVFPNPASSKVTMKGANLENYDAIVLHDSFGREVPLKNPIVKNSFNISNLKNGIYFVVFKKDNEVSVVKKLLKF
ncbi:T9SS type A sorting domain-containing protein [Aureibaculum sp. 2210JD6-5]|uniref:T9SS type A sorting domain-containing protein n=1 Tax=Aureibaculum sp. 2210JD6-5 TaxID=3103957 RepID=UPI002AAEF7AD|nr:T9SS type A sorting domain-containing protein [Aureibaculum sp. 2210JD6-5]MDY7396362.1 T9SS type A sorting domain-containing protein [Aureibaculum sp. 2210JD6-5]